MWLERKDDDVELSVDSFDLVSVFEELYRDGLEAFRLCIGRSHPLKSKRRRALPPSEFQTLRVKQKRKGSQTCKFVRKAVLLSVAGIQTFGRPDSGCQKNVVSKAFVEENGIPISASENDLDVFQFGSGKSVSSIGRVNIPCGISGVESSFSHRDFHVMENLVVPVILGLDFLQETQLYTENGHLLVDCPKHLLSPPQLMCMGSSQACIPLRADGRALLGCADTGSDLNCISLRCVRRSRFRVDRGSTARSRILLPDGSKVESLGKVRISSLKIKGLKAVKMEFNVVRGLSSDILLGEEFLHKIDAFNTCVITMDDEESLEYSLKTLINLGPKQAFIAQHWKGKRLKKLSMAQENLSEREKHDLEIEGERFHRHNRKRLIRRQDDEEERERLVVQEERRREIFDDRHIGCLFCIGNGLYTNHLRDAGPVSTRSDFG